MASQALATFPTLLMQDFQAFHGQALDALRVWSPQDPNKLAVVVRDLSSQQVVNTRLPWGLPLPRGTNPEVDKEVVQSARAVIQGLFVGATSGRPIISIRVPVMREGKVTHVLSMAVEPERFAEIIGSEKLPSGWVGTLVDRDDRVIARSREHDRFVGQLAPAEFGAEGGGEGGVWTGRNLNGEPVLAAYSARPFRDGRLTSVYRWMQPINRCAPRFSSLRLLAYLRSPYRFFWQSPSASVSPNH